MKKILRTNHVHNKYTDFYFGGTVAFSCPPIPTFYKQIESYRFATTYKNETYV